MFSSQIKHSRTLPFSYFSMSKHIFQNADAAKNESVPPALPEGAPQESKRELAEIRSTVEAKSEVRQEAAKDRGEVADTVEAVRQKKEQGLKKVSEVIGESQEDIQNAILNYELAEYKNPLHPDNAQRIIDKIKDAKKAGRLKNITFIYTGRTDGNRHDLNKIAAKAEQEKTDWHKEKAKTLQLLLDIKDHIQPESIVDSLRNNESLIKEYKKTVDFNGDIDGFLRSHDAEFCDAGGIFDIALSFQRIATLHGKISDEKVSTEKGTLYLEVNGSEKGEDYRTAKVEFSFNGEEKETKEKAILQPEVPKKAKIEPEFKPKVEVVPQVLETLGIVTEKDKTVITLKIENKEYRRTLDTSGIGLPVTVRENKELINGHKAFEVIVTEGGVERVLTHMYFSSVPGATGEPQLVCPELLISKEYEVEYGKDGLITFKKRKLIAVVTQGVVGRAVQQAEVAPALTPAEEFKKDQQNLEIGVREIGRMVGENIFIDKNISPKKINEQLPKIAEVINSLDIETRNKLNLVSIILSTKNDDIKEDRYGFVVKIDVSATPEDMKKWLTEKSEDILRIRHLGDTVAESEARNEAGLQHVPFENQREAFKKGHIKWGGPNTIPQAGYFWTQKVEDPRYNFAVETPEETQKREKNEKHGVMGTFDDERPKTDKPELDEDEARIAKKYEAVVAKKDDLKNLEDAIKKEYRGYMLIVMDKITVDDASNEDEIDKTDRELDAMIANMGNLSAALNAMKNDENTLMGVSWLNIIPSLEVDEKQEQLRKVKDSFELFVNIKADPESVQAQLTEGINNLKQIPNFLENTALEEKEKKVADKKKIPFMNGRQAWAEGKIIRSHGDWKEADGSKFVDDKSKLNYAVNPVEPVVPVVPPAPELKPEPTPEPEKKDDKKSEEPEKKEKEGRGGDDEPEPEKIKPMDNYPRDSSEHTLREWIGPNGFKSINFWSDEVSGYDYGKVRRNSKKIQDAMKDAAAEIMKGGNKDEIAAIGALPVYINPNKSWDSAFVAEGLHDKEGKSSAVIGINSNEDQIDIKNDIIKAVKEYVTSYIHIPTPAPKYEKEGRN